MNGRGHTPTQVIVDEVQRVESLEQQWLDVRNDIRLIEDELAKFDELLATTDYPRAERRRRGITPANRAKFVSTLNAARAEQARLRDLIDAQPDPASETRSSGWSQ